MATQAISIPAAARLMHMGDGLILHQALYAAAQLGIADLLASGPRSTAELAAELQVNQDAFADCDFFREVPQGCRAYMMKSVIHDWNNEDAHRILVNCREATPNNGALLLIEWDLPEDNAPSRGTYADLVMMVLTGGKERTIEEYRTLLRGAGFALNKVTPTSAELNLIEALPV